MDRLPLVPCCSREVVGAHPDHLEAALKTVIHNELGAARNPGNMQLMVILISSQKDLAAKVTPLPPTPLPPQFPSLLNSPPPQLPSPLNSPPPSTPLPPQLPSPLNSPPPQLPSPLLLVAGCCRRVHGSPVAARGLSQATSQSTEGNTATDEEQL